MSLIRKVATSYVHEQTTPSATWTIVHNLGQYPVVDVYVVHESQLQKIIPSLVSFTDNNTVVINFAVPRSGFATVA